MFGRPYHHPYEAFQNEHGELVVAEFKEHLVRLVYQQSAEV